MTYNQLINWLNGLKGGMHYYQQLTSTIYITQSIIEKLNNSSELLPSTVGTKLQRNGIVLIWDFDISLIYLQINNNNQYIITTIAKHPDNSLSPSTVLNKIQLMTYFIARLKEYINQCDNLATIESTVAPVDTSASISTPESISTSTPMPADHKIYYTCAVKVTIGDIDDYYSITSFSLSDMYCQLGYYQQEGATVEYGPILKSRFIESIEVSMDDIINTPPYKQMELMRSQRYERQRFKRLNKRQQNFDTHALISYMFSPVDQKK